MALTPIDIAAPVQRSSDVIQAGNNASHRPEVMQQQFADHIKREVVRTDKYVKQSDKSDMDRIVADKRGRREDRRRQKKQRDQGQTERENGQAALSSAVDGSLLDIRI